LSVSLCRAPFHQDTMRIVRLSVPIGHSNEKDVGLDCSKPSRTEPTEWMKTTTTTKTTKSIMFPRKMKLDFMTPRSTISRMLSLTRHCTTRWKNFARYWRMYDLYFLSIQFFPLFWKIAWRSRKPYPWRICHWLKLPHWLGVPYPELCNKRLWTWTDVQAMNLWSPKILGCCRSPARPKCGKADTNEVTSDTSMPICPHCICESPVSRCIFILPARFRPKTLVWYSTVDLTGILARYFDITTSGQAKRALTRELLTESPAGGRDLAQWRRGRISGTRKPVSDMPLWVSDPAMPDGRAKSTHNIFSTAMWCICKVDDSWMDGWLYWYFSWMDGWMNEWKKNTIL
jgi:hypothetical protein